VRRTEHAAFEEMLEEAIELSRNIAARLEDLEARYPSESLREAISYLRMQVSRNEHISAQDSPNPTAEQQAAG
jgi:hypothetical protein